MGDRKIEAMHKLFGITPGQKCGDCPHLRIYEQSRRWYKCSIYGCTRSASSDWAKKWQACGLFGKPAPKGYTSIIKTLLSDPKKLLPVEGQIDMFGGTVE